MKEPPNFFREPLFWPAFAMSGLVLSLTLWFNLGMDQAIHAYVVWVWREYHLPPYLGVWNHNFPGIYFFHWLSQELFGETPFGFRLLDFLLQFGAAGMVYYLARRLTGLSLAGFLAAVFYALYYYGMGSAGDGNKEAMIGWVFLLALTLTLALERKTMLQAALVGLCLGFAFLIKPTYGLAGPVFGIYFLAQGRGLASPVRAAPLIMFSFLCLAPSLAVFVYYWRLNYLTELYQILIQYNYEIYGKMAAPGTAARIWRHAVLPYLLLREQPLLLFTALPMILLGLSGRKSIKDKALFWLTLALIAVGLFNYRFQAKFFDYHQMVFWGLLTIYSGAGCAWLINLVCSRLGRVPAKVFSAAASLALLALMAWGINPGLRNFAAHDCFRPLDRAYQAGFNTEQDLQWTADYYATAEYLRPRLKPDDTLVVFGGYPLVPYLLHRKMPTSFPCTHQLVLVRYGRGLEPWQEKWIERYSDEIISGRPRFFLLNQRFPGSRSKLVSFATRDLDQCFRERFPELYRFFRENYRLRTKLGRIRIYELITEG